jgi:hypothetical protein
MDAIIAEMQADREANTALIGAVAEGQKEIAEGLKMMAAVQSAPVKIISPEGRTFIKQPVVN